MQNGVHYWFTSKELMQQQIKDGKFLETATVHSQLYGTSRRAVQSVAEKGKCCILDIDVQVCPQSAPPLVAHTASDQANSAQCSGGCTGMGRPAWRVSPLFGGLLGPPQPVICRGRPA